MSITTTFQGEMQLAGWNQTHNGGSKITFWLPDDSDLDVFKGLTAKKGNTSGHRFMAVLVEIGDDEQPVNSTVNESSTIDKNKGGELAKWAGILCNDSIFWKWIETTSDEYGHLVVGHNQAVDFIYSSCNITSRAQLDHNLMAAKIFREEVMAKFDAWKGAQ